MPGRHICILTALLAGAAFGQSASRTFYFSHVDSPKALQESLNMVRSMGDIRDATADVEKKSITVSGTPEQISVAAWLCNELDRAPESRPAMVRREYPGTLTDTRGENQVLRAYFLAHIESQQELQEVTNLSRSIADIQRFFPHNGVYAIVARGTKEQTDLTDWLLSELDRPSNTPMEPGHREHSFSSDPRAGVAQLYVLANTETPTAVQEIVNCTRSMADIQRVFPFTSRKVLAMRASAEQIDFADWMLQELDKPAAGAVLDSAPHEYRVPFTVEKNSMARVFFLNHVESPQALQEIVNLVRSTVAVPRAFPNNQSKALAMRGTADQIARAEQIIKEQDR